MEGQYRKIEINEFVAGGKGKVILRHILNEGELNGKCRMYAEVTLAPGCSIGEHPHHGETETYYILKGAGTYSDNGESVPCSREISLSVPMATPMDWRIPGQKTWYLWR